MDIQFFKRMIQVYEKKNSTPEQWKDLYETIFKELSTIKPEQLIPDHLDLFKQAEEYFASIDQFEKAQAINSLHKAANNIFKAREMVEEIKNILINKNLN